MNYLRNQHYIFEKSKQTKSKKKNYCEDKEMLTVLIIVEEIKLAVKQLAKNVCPGLDDITTKVYENYFDKKKYTLHSVYKLQITSYVKRA